MKKLLVLVALGFVACGQATDSMVEDAYEIPPQFQTYTPQNVDLIRVAVAEHFGIDPETMGGEHFVWGSQEQVKDHCKNDKAAACVNSEHQVVYVAGWAMNQCGIIAHEFTHQALFIKTGDPDHDHKDPLFDPEAENKLCDEHVRNQPGAEGPK